MIRKFWFTKFTIIFITISLHLPVIASPTELSLQAQEAFEMGDFEQAISYWKKALAAIEPDVPQSIEILTRLATAYQAIGDYTSAYTLLQRAFTLADQQGHVDQKILIHSSLGEVLLGLQKIQEAKTYLETGLTMARLANKASLIAHLLNNLGNVQTVQQDNAQAFITYTEAGKYAQNQNDTTLSIQILLNLAQVSIKQNDLQAAVKTLQTAKSQLSQRPVNYRKALQLLSLGKLNLTIHAQQPQANDLLTETHPLLMEALQFAEQYQNHRLIAYSKGFLGEVYERSHRYSEALQLTREAIFNSQNIQDLRYRWEWQQGRLLQAQQEFDGAIVAYQRALDYLKPVRSQLTIGQMDASEIFRHYMRPLYFSLADVLLQKAAIEPSMSQKTDLLYRARESVELLKAAELQDYFQDECVSAIQSKVKPLDTLDEHTAVLYPILLQERTELLLSLPDGIRQYIVPISAEKLGQIVVEFRQNLQTTVHYRFFNQSKQLYQWLIAPIVNDLKTHQIHTLVIVPDGPLRMIPMAALFDEIDKKFLIHQFALATTPGLDLTEPRALARDEMLVLINGLSEGVQNFAPLPNVPEEVGIIKSLFAHSNLLLDQEFLSASVEEALKKTPYSIVHIASHGQFDRDPKKTFILTYNDKLTMDRLEQLLTLGELRAEPVELLTLSACQTAVGDERAALGLAGVAIKAGARSALASLWFVNDESTALLITEFYQQLKNSDLSKAQALQKAQIKLMEDRKFQHPTYWAPFLLIGNWL